MRGPDSQSPHSLAGHGERTHPCPDRPVGYFCRNKTAMTEGFRTVIGHEEGASMYSSSTLQSLEGRCSQSSGGGWASSFGSSSLKEDSCSGASLSGQFCSGCLTTHGGHYCGFSRRTFISGSCGPSAERGAHGFYRCSKCALGRFHWSCN